MGPVTAWAGRVEIMPSLPAFGYSTKLCVRVPAPPVQTVREDPTLGGCRPVNAVNVVVGASSGHCESPVDTSTGIVLLLPCYLFIVDICSSTA